MSDANRVDLSKLNEAERRALAMLARGHTAKSIASEMKVTVGSVNERLREARRKTGVGSSRELARLLHAQENRDEQIGVAPSLQHQSSSVPEDASGDAPRRKRKGFLVMSMVIATSVGLLAWLAQGPPDDGSRRSEPVASTRDLREDELLGSFAHRPEQRVAILHGKVRRERRDAAWAGEAEAALKQRFAWVEGGAPGGRLRVTCGSSLCEVAGHVSGSGNELVQSMDRVLSETLERHAPPAGLRFVTSTTGAGAFVVYWSRSNA